MAYPTGPAQYQAYYLPMWYAANVSPGLKTCGVLVLLLFCYLVQWLFQDVLVAWLYSRALKCLSNRRRQVK